MATQKARRSQFRVAILTFSKSSVLRDARAVVPSVSVNLGFIQFRCPSRRKPKDSFQPRAFFGPSTPGVRYGGCRILRFSRRRLRHQRVCPCNPIGSAFRHRIVCRRSGALSRFAGQSRPGFRLRQCDFGGFFQLSQEPARAFAHMGSERTRCAPFSRRQLSQLSNSAMVRFGLRVTLIPAEDRHYGEDAQLVSVGSLLLRR